MQRAIRPRAQRIRHPFSKASARYATLIEKDCTSITPPYATLVSNLKHVRAILKRPLTLAEKFLYSHPFEPQKFFLPGGKVRGEAYLQLRPQRVAMQDASAQYVHIPYTDIAFNLTLHLEWHCNSTALILCLPRLTRALDCNS